MNPILSILCTIGAVVVYVIILVFLTFAINKALDRDITDDNELIMTACIIQFMVAMIVISIYFSGFMGDSV